MLVGVVKRIPYKNVIKFIGKPGDRGGKLTGRFLLKHQNLICFQKL